MEPRGGARAIGRARAVVPAQLAGTSGRMIAAAVGSGDGSDASTVRARPRASAGVHIPTPERLLSIALWVGMLCWVFQFW